MDEAHLEDGKDVENETLLKIKHSRSIDCTSAGRDIFQDLVKFIAFYSSYSQHPWYHQSSLLSSQYIWITSAFHFHLLRTKQRV